MLKYLPLYFEKYLPVSLGGVVFVLLTVFRGDLLSADLLNVISINSTASAVFGWSSIQTGFMFGVFSFISTKNDGFVGRIRNSTALRNFILYTRSATYLGFFLTLSTMPLLAVNFTGNEIDFRLYVIICVWFSFFIWTFAAFVRVAYIFSILIKIEERDESDITE